MGLVFGWNIEQNGLQRCPSFHCAVLFEPHPGSVVLSFLYCFEYFPHKPKYICCILSYKPHTILYINSHGYIKRLLWPFSYSYSNYVETILIWFHLWYYLIEHLVGFPLDQRIGYETLLFKVISGHEISRLFWWCHVFSTSTTLKIQCRKQYYIYLLPSSYLFIFSFYYSLSQLY